MSKYQFSGNFEHIKIKAHVRAELIFGFILNIDPAKITNQRKAWLKKYESTIHWIRQHLAEEYHDIFQFIGFLGQIKTKDTLNHGLSKEDILVDVNGKSIG